MLSSKPKFIFALVITDIQNVPKHSGSCFVKWRILNTLPSIKGRTPAAHVKDFKAVWKHTEEGIVKVGTKDKALQPKIVELEVYHITRHHSHHHHQNNYHPDIPLLDELPSVRQTSYLGKVTVNLSEFAGIEGTQPMRYLLKDSKVNAVLNVEVGMTLIKGNLADYVVPPIRSKGLLNMFEDSVYESSSSGSKHGAASAVSPFSESKLHRSAKITSDPVITRLYQKTFEISWDRRPGEFSAEECVDDIIVGGDGWAKNEEGENFIDVQLASLKSHSHHQARHNTLYSPTTEYESVQTPSHKSWQVHHIVR
ncbi:uncharacterized protein CYBJADRAFT_160854 [Cyberlindnera jadinii NRRL Y-1542]|uniref:C2 NT-type domain-containing protein n=1 Tax=Cyberlindnera jadinii (strain ATCC 18201 / CBS 1600 / BCRC 20928 / JCM 3617 / NBRC 0987 / NRRL Y-1542) TaxID=983966 RepID=A0A1E4S7S2_CYBJN|nr:hypothetical protein CYBJADRAFT_160854 [Cyberlindnera jadinii NRRL Y-1542]ODV75432.1 hypothetical protein CYBJADRAFT_160854 [Cyberlindnera jadinii NRRL Y-1542]